jgi:hypothetical protein
MKLKQMSEVREPLLMRRVNATQGAVRAALIGSVCAGVFALSACSGEGAGAQGSLPGTTQPGPGDQGGLNGTGQITVTGAIPTSGLGTVVTQTGTSTLGTLGTSAIVQISGQVSGSTVLHRFLVEYEPLSGQVQSVTHAWGTSLEAAEALVQCVRVITNPSVIQQLCGDTVRIVPSTSQITFNAVLLKSGTYQSVLNGTVLFAPL